MTKKQPPKRKHDRFVGRVKELSLLKSKLDLDHSTMTAIHGRRRIGKTALVEHAFKNTRFIKFEGLEGENDAFQRRQFASTLERHSHRAEHGLLDTSDWTKLLIALSAYIGSEPIVVFFDEFQWMASEKTQLVSHLKYVWDNYFSTKNNVQLIICGSVSSFIVKKVIRSRALFGRIDSFIDLQELNLKEVLGEFFVGKKSSMKNILNFYLAVGGVPKYLQLFNPTQSFELNMQRLAFNSDGYFYNEVDRLFVSHLGHNPIFRKVISILAKYSHMTQTQIQSKLKLNSGGRFSEYLEELELAGFIQSYRSIHRKDARNLVRFRLKDPFLRFYFRFIDPKKSAISRSSQTESQFSSFVSQHSFETWKGLAFEQCCRDHHSLIARKLQFGAVSYECGAWYHRDDQKTGAQIDLVFIRKDRVATICEIKYRKSIPERAIRKDLLSKVEIIQTEAKPDATQSVLICVDKPKNFEELKEIFDEIITIDFLYDK